MPYACAGSRPNRMIDVECVFGSPEERYFRRAAFLRGLIFHSHSGPKRRAAAILFLREQRGATKAAIMFAQSGQS